MRKQLKLLGVCVRERERDRERAIEKTESRKEIKSPFLFKRKRS